MNFNASISCAGVCTVLILIFVDKTSCNTLDCASAYDCSNQDILFRNGSIKCYGDHSCSHSNVTIDTTAFEYPSITRYDLDCYGSHACFGSNKLEIISQNLKNIFIHCNGLYSCANIESISFSLGNRTTSSKLRCYGESACANSTIYTADNTIIWADTERGIADSIVISQGNDVQVTATGRLSAQNTIFYSNGSNNLYKFVGSGSGNNSTIYCANNQTCQVKCNHNACNFVNFRCWNGNNEGDDNYNCTFDVTCSNAEKSDICPDGLNIVTIIDAIQQFSSIDNIENIVYQIGNININDWNTSMTSQENSQGICSNYNNLKNSTTASDNIFCNDYNECTLSRNTSNTTYSLTRNDTSNGTICCLGANTCTDITRITTSSMTNIGIRCDGYLSCLGSTNQLILSSTHGNIYQTSRGSNSNPNVNSSIECQNCDIFCSANNVCSYLTIVSTRNLFCLAQFSCSEIKAKNIGQNIFVGTYYAARYLNVDSVTGSVFCDGEGSCNSATMTNIGKDIYGNGADSLFNATIDNVTHSVLAFGSNSLRQGQITVAKNVCHAFFSILHAFVAFKVLILQDTIHNKT